MNVLAYILGEEKDGNEIGQFGLGKRNERGQKLIKFCRGNKLMAANTWLEHEKSWQYTWKQPGDLARYKLDYILVRQRFHNSVKNARSRSV